LTEAESQSPEDPQAAFQPIPIAPLPQVTPPRTKTQPKRSSGCWLIFAFALLLLAVYFIFPLRTNIVVFGIDARTAGEVMARSDTLILLTLNPSARYVGMLSIPRDLWVTIPGVGENRINTAHFFAETALPGSGPQAVKSVIELNFGIPVDGYVRVSFDHFKQLVETLGGVQITLTEPLGGYPAGTHLLDAEQALAFVRDRTTGGDDFARMRQTQEFVRALIATALLPDNLARAPEIMRMGLRALETDIPAHQWPRLALGMLLSLPDGIDGRVISRDMVAPFTTEQGARVLAPRWELIRPVLVEMFGE
jgi:LCP family protein required for cell wall assembly